MTEEQLQAIEERAAIYRPDVVFDDVALLEWQEARETLARHDVPALLAHCRAQAAEIERLEERLIRILAIAQPGP